MLIALRAQSPGSMSQIRKQRSRDDEKMEKPFDSESSDKAHKKLPLSVGVVSGAWTDQVDKDWRTLGTG